MPQEFQVLQCYHCQTFQVHQVKKTTKWACKMCGEKQSIKKVYGRGSGADCRFHVQKLNTHRGELDSVCSDRPLHPGIIIQNESYAIDGEKADVDSPETSKWVEFVEDEPDDRLMNDDDNDGPQYTTNAGDLHAAQGRGMKRSSFQKQDAISSKSKWRRYDGDTTNDADDYASPGVKPLYQTSRTFQAGARSSSDSFHGYPQSESQPSTSGMNNASFLYQKNPTSDNKFSVKRNDNHGSINATGKQGPSFSKGKKRSSFPINSGRFISSVGTYADIDGHGILDNEFNSRKKQHIQNIQHEKLNSYGIKTGSNFEDKYKKVQNTGTKWNDFIEKSNGIENDYQSPACSSDMNHTGDYSKDMAAKTRHSSTLRSESVVKDGSYEPSSQKSTCTSPKGDNSQEDECHGVLNTNAKFPDMRPYVSFDDLETCVLQADTERCIISPTNQKFAMRGQAVCDTIKPASSSKWAAFAEDGDSSVAGLKTRMFCSDDTCNKENCAQQVNDLSSEGRRSSKGNVESFLRTSTLQIPAGEEQERTGSKPVSIKTESLFKIGDLVDDDFDL